jgi:dodecin
LPERLLACLAARPPAGSCFNHIPHHRPGVGNGSPNREINGNQPVQGNRRPVSRNTCMAKRPSSKSPSISSASGSTSVSVAKIIEIKATSKKSFEDAIESGIKRASKTVSDIKGAWVAEQEVRVENGKVTEYRVLMRVTFVLK